MNLSAAILTANLQGAAMNSGRTASRMDNELLALSAIGREQ